MVELPPFFLSYHLAASSRCHPTTPFSPIPPVFREIRVAFRKRSYFLCGWMSNANEFLFPLLFYYRISAYSRILISIRRVVSFESVLRKRFGNSDDRFEINSFLSINLYEKRFVKRSIFTFRLDARENVKTKVQNEEIKSISTGLYTTDYGRCREIWRMGEQTIIRIYRERHLPNLFLR